jgi:hypothetical protein
MNMHPVRNRRSRIFGAARQRDMRMKRAYVQLKSGGQQRVVDPLPQLE